MKQMGSGGGFGTGATEPTQLSSGVVLPEHGAETELGLARKRLAALLAGREPIGLWQLLCWAYAREMVRFTCGTDFYEREWGGGAMRPARRAAGPSCARPVAARCGPKFH